jgi:hypothetical protein
MRLTRRPSPRRSPGGSPMSPRRTSKPGSAETS